MTKIAPAPKSQPKLHGVVLDWVRKVNRVLGPRATSRVRGHGDGNRPSVFHEVIDPAPGMATYRFSAQDAHALVLGGIDPSAIDELAHASHLPPLELQRFAGVDRTTLRRRADQGKSLPEEAAVKTLMAAELLALAAEVFGSVEVGSDWLTTPHPALEGDAPLERARTPWGLAKVREILVATRYGGVV